MMIKINNYPACVQLISHPDTFGIRVKRGNQLLACVDPQIPIAGVAERLSIQGFVGLYHVTHLPHGN